MEFFAPFLFMYELSKVDVAEVYTSLGGKEYKKLVTPVGCTHYVQEHLGRESGAIYRNRCNRDKNMWQMNEPR